MNGGSEGKGVRGWGVARAVWRLIGGVHAYVDTADAVVAGIAAGQHGVISVAQMLRAGLTHDAVRWRVSQGRLHRIYHSVYAVGHAGITDKGRWKAATLALGDNAYLSHRSAAELWELLPLTGSTPSLTVVGTSGRSKRPGLHTARARSNEP